jgi:O-antigen ligase
MVAVLPLHTVYLSAWISWKPFLVLTAVLAVWDLVDGLRNRSWPWHRATTRALTLFLAVVATGFPIPEHRDRFVRLFLALIVGGLVMLVTARSLQKPGMIDRALRVVFWGAVAMGVTGLLISVALVGVFGNDVINYLTGAVGYDLPLIDKVGKPAYLLSHFLALSNWHQDPGYGAAWGVLWSTLALYASLTGKGTGRGWLDGALLGGLWLAVVMAFSRTGWIGLVIAIGLVGFVTARKRIARSREIWRRLAAAVLTVIVLLAFLFMVDVEDVGGDLDIQFAFRFRQGWDLLADLTGLFQGSEAFEDAFAESEQRADVWPEYWEMFQSDPLTGVGLGVGWETNSAGQEPHNLLLELGAETGLLGIAAFAVLMTIIVSSGAGLPGGLALAASLLPAMTQTVLFEPTWWFAAGLFLAGKLGQSAQPGLESPEESGEITPQSAGG